MPESESEFQPIEFLRGDRLYLRPLEESDLPRCQRWINDPSVRRFLLPQRPMDFAAELAWWKNNDRDTLPRSLVLAIVLRDGHRHVGNTGLHAIDWINRMAETGTLIGEADCREKGYGSEAKELLLEYAFQTLNLHRINSHTMEFNARSAAYLRKTGYVEEGRLRQAYFRDGEYHDAIIFGLLREDWLKRT
jgi:RimJ/RimL family protein N-acetyltransferase